MRDKTVMCKGDNQMKKIFFGTLFLALVIVVTIPTMAMGGDVDISISLPPLIVFAAPPEVVVIPETYVYFVPDLDEDIFFYDGWWWRPWEGRWYRSKDYKSGWSHYQGVPSFHREIPPGWRNDYKNHKWKDHQWNPQRIHHQEVQQNWGNWEKNRYWEKQNTWGVQGLKSRTQSQQPSQTVQPQQSQPQDQRATQKSKSRDEKSEKGKEEKQDKK
jgi:hypothetical protein